MTTFSKGQFKALAEQANQGGFSVRPTPGAQGEVEHVTDAYMVGGVPGQQSASHDSPLQPRQVASFMRGNRSLLSQPGMSMGAWHDEGRTPTPQVDLDVSQALPRSPEGKREASMLSLGRNEMAFGEVSGGDYTQHDNPFSTRRSLADYQTTMYANPKAHLAIASGNVLGGMSAWAADR